MSEDGSEKGGLSRRGFLKFLGLGVGVVAGKKAIDAAESIRWDPTRPERLRELLGKEGVTPYNFSGKVKINPGTVIYKEPHEYAKEKPGKLITTYSPGNTELGSLSPEENLFVENPFLFLSEGPGSNETGIVLEVIRPDGQRVTIDTQSIWVIFNLREADIPRSLRGDSPFGVGCVRVSGANVEFYSGGGEVSFFPKPDDIKSGGPINFGRVISS